VEFLPHVTRLLGDEDEEFEDWLEDPVGLDGMVEDITS
jgi:hypothetical protein